MATSVMIFIMNSTWTVEQENYLFTNYGQIYKTSQLLAVCNVTANSRRAWQAYIYVHIYMYIYVHIFKEHVTIL